MDRAPPERAPRPGALQTSAGWSWFRRWPDSGKSTLLADWAAAAALPCAWFSLDAQDNQPSLFWAYLITALQRQSPGFAQALLVELLSPQAPPAERFLPEFLNQAAQLPGRIVIVLDDYHLIENPAIHDSLIFLIEHLARNPVGGDLHPFRPAHAAQPVAGARLPDRSSVARLALYLR